MDPYLAHVLAIAGYSPGAVAGAVETERQWPTLDAARAPQPVGPPTVVELAAAAHPRGLCFDWTTLVFSAVLGGLVGYALGRPK
jgi:hypothetical protein